jgi:hypothetical protein
LGNLENLINLKILHCCNNQLISLEGIENLIRLIKNNNNILNDMFINFADADDYIELKNLFDNLLNCKNNYKIDEEIEKMIIKLYRFQKYVLK